METDESDLRCRLLELVKTIPAHSHTLWIQRAKVIGVCFDDHKVISDIQVKETCKNYPEARQFFSGLFQNVMEKPDLPKLIAACPSPTLYERMIGEINKEIKRFDSDIRREAVKWYQEIENGENGMIFFF